MEKKDDNDEGHGDHFLSQLIFQCVDGTQDQVGAIIRCMDLHSGGEPFFQLFQTIFNAVNDFQCILTEANHDDTRYGFSLTVHFDYATTDFWADLDVRNLRKHDRGMCISINPYGNVFQIINGRDIAFTTNHKFGFTHFQETATHIHIGAFDSHVDML